MPLMQRHKAKPSCPTHGKPLDYRHGKFGGFYACLHYPDGCEITAGRSKFDQHYYLSDQAMRDLKHAAHDAFDALWRSCAMSRSDAYHWLQEVMGVAKDQAHIQHFTADQCERVVGLANAKLEELDPVKR